jgi:hypothetical protein
MWVATDDELRQAAERVAAAAVAEARTLASERLLTWLAQSGAVTVPDTLAKQPGAVTAVLLARDSSDPRYAVLGAFAGRWACDVLRIVRAALLQRRGRAASRTPDVLAVEYAVSVGVTWTAIANALGVTAPTAHGRYHDKVSLITG